MDFSTLNRLILEHLRFYGYQLAARILESEFKSKKPADQSNPSKLYEIILKFVELYGKPDLWKDQVETSKAFDRDAHRVYLPKMNSPFVGVQSNKSESYNGPFHQGNESYLAPNGRNSPRKNGARMGNTAPVQARNTQNPNGGPNVKNYSNQASHLMFISRALNNGQPPVTQEDSSDGPREQSPERRNNSNNSLPTQYVGPYSVKKGMQQKSQGSTNFPMANKIGRMNRNDSLNEGSSPYIAYQNPSNLQMRQNSSYLEEQNSKQMKHRSTSVPQAENYYQRALLKDKPSFGAQARRQESFLAETEASTVDAERSFMSGVDNNERINRSHLDFATTDGEDRFEQPERMKPIPKGGYGPIGNIGRNEKSFDHGAEYLNKKRILKQVSERKPPQEGSLMQNYNTFLSRKGTFGKEDEMIKNEGMGGLPRRIEKGSNFPSSVRVDSENTLPVNNSGTKGSYWNDGPQFQPPSQQNRQQPRQEDRFERSMGNAGSERGIGRGLKFEEQREGERNRGRAERIERGEEALKERSQHTISIEPESAHNRLTGTLVSYLMENTQFKEFEIKELFEVYTSLGGRLGNSGGLDKGKFTEFLNRTKNILSKSFVENLFAFGSHLGILSGSPPRVGFEESLIILSQLSHQNPMELLKFLFMVGSGGRREIKLSVLDHILRELSTCENKAKVMVLSRSLDYVLSQGNHTKDDLMTLDDFSATTNGFFDSERF